MQRLAIASALFFLIPFFARASEPVFISEVAWAGSSASIADEWIEVCGPAGTDLSGWKIEGAAASGLPFPEGSVIPASGAFLVANYREDDPKTTLSVPPNWVTTAVSLSNANLFLSLHDASGTLIDVAGASGTAPLAGTSGDAKASMERLLPLGDGGFADSWRSAAASSGFQASATELGSPGACPHISQAVPEPAEPAQPAETATTTMETEPVPPAQQPPLAPTTTVRISEIYPAPLSGEQEWIELVNPSGTGEVLDEWTLEDGKGTPTRLSGTLLPWARLVISAPKGSLNNDGDLVVLKDAQGRILDGVAYGAWETALHPRVGNVGKGEAVIRIELQERFEVTLTPTPDEANIFTQSQAEEKPAPAHAPTAPPAPPVVSQAVVSDAPSTSAPQRPATPTMAAPLPQQAPKEHRKAAAAKPAAQKPAASRYKGTTQTATIAVPAGVYGKTRLYVLQGDDVKELRLSKSTSAKWQSGQRIAFVAQAKEEGGEAYLLANPNSVRLLGEAASGTFALIERWPESAGSYRLSAEVKAVHGTTLEVSLGGAEGDVLLPKALSGLKPGDQLEIEGFVAPGTRPRVVLTHTNAIRAFATAGTASDSTPFIPRLPWPAMAGLTVAAAAMGLLVYLRQERLKRLALAMQPIEDDLS